MIQFAGAGDADEIASLHVRTWAETYAGLLPEAEIVRFDLGFRRRQWARVLGETEGAGRVALLPGLGFAMMGPQRDAGRAAEWPDELYALYLLCAGQGRGHGRALLEAVRRGPFTATVLVGNVRAGRFYAAAGGVELARQRVAVAGGEVVEAVLGFRG